MEPRKSDLYIGIVMIVLPVIFIYFAYYNGQYEIAQLNKDPFQFKFFKGARMITLFAYPFLAFGGVIFIREYFQALKKSKK